MRTLPSSSKLEWCQTALFYNMAQSGTIPTSMMREVFFGSVYKMLVKRKDVPKPEAFVFGTENHAMRAEKALFDLAAVWALTQPALLDYLNSASSDEICSALHADSKPIPAFEEFSTRFESYLREFGHAIYDLDFAKPTPHDDPTPLIETLKIYLTGSNNPYERQRAALDLRAPTASGGTAMPCVGRSFSHGADSSLAAPNRPRRFHRR